jgi:hypothetical protein
MRLPCRWRREGTNTATALADPAKENCMEGYTQFFFGTPQQPNLPARSVMALAGPIPAGWSRSR